MRLIDADALKSMIPITFYRSIDCSTCATLSEERVRKLIDNEPEAVIRCCECEKWDSGSGLTVQTCFEWGRPTKQFEYCSRGRKKCG